MNELILNVVRFNEKVDYTMIVPLILVYIFLFWVIVSVWVYTDSRQRYAGKKRPLLLALLNFLFGVPFLFLYILARPFEIDDNAIDEMKQQDRGGVNVPIVNFIGKEGVVMSLELRINAKRLASEDSSEMKIDVSFNPSDQDKVVVEKSEKVELKSISDTSSKPNDARFAGKLFKFFRKTEDTKPIDEQNKSSFNVSINTESENNSNTGKELQNANYKKNKNKKRKKKKN